MSLYMYLYNVYMYNYVHTRTYIVKKFAKKVPRRRYKNMTCRGAKKKEI